VLLDSLFVRQNRVCSSSQCRRYRLRQRQSRDVYIYCEHERFGFSLWCTAQAIKPAVSSHWFLIVAEGQTDVSVLLIALRHGVVMAKVHHFPSLLNADTRRSYLTDAYDALFVTVLSPCSVSHFRSEYLSSKISSSGIYRLP